jgi:hypothetical protein
MKAKKVYEVFKKSSKEEEIKGIIGIGEYAKLDYMLRNRKSIDELEDELGWLDNDYDPVFQDEFLDRLYELLEESELYDQFEMDPKYSDEIVKIWKTKYGPVVADPFDYGISYATTHQNLDRMMDYLTDGGRIQEN